MSERWRGKWAVVTGASAGIGTALARLLAGGGTNLVLTARRRERLEKLAAELTAANKIQVEIVAADLERPSAPGEIYAFTAGKRIDVDLLINNAGFGHYGAFSSEPLEPQLGMVQVNCAAVVQLTHLYLPGMVQRRRGDILIFASTASFQAVPYISVYAASKAFDLLFAEGLAEEVRAVRRARLRALPRLDDYGIPSGCGAAGSFEEEAGDGGKGGARGAGGFGGGEELRDFGICELCECSCGASRAAEICDAHGGENVCAEIGKCTTAETQSAQRKPTLRRGLWLWLVFRLPIDPLVSWCLLRCRLFGLARATGGA